MTRRVRELEHPHHPYHHAPRNTWLVTGTPIDRTYPCRCNPDGCRNTCPCRGRLDTLDLPARCCARRAADTAARHEAKELAA